MGYFRECPDCGAHLDPGERCECDKEEDYECRKENATIRATSKSTDSFARSALT